ncbi:MAG: hypothetical protein EXS17_02890 [Phycisphaerales bacterium]|nr:hypothetical protein [Phycisphaerales bacterium]
MHSALSARFTAGPAAATNAHPLRPFRNRDGFTGINPQAIPMINRAMMLNHPICTMGFRVM